MSPRRRRVFRFLVSVAVALFCVLVFLIAAVTVRASTPSMHAITLGWGMVLGG